MKLKQCSLKMLLILSFIAISMVVKAQVLVKGSVVDKNGESLIGVSIVVSTDKSKGTTTDLDGKFAITVPNKSASLRFSYMGFKDLEQAVTVDKPMYITMQEEDSYLDEVMVIGYQEIRRRDLTGSVGKANLDDMLKSQVSSFDQAMAGRLAGVQVSSAEGTPGSTMNIVIRGANSITGDNSPLYVIDGFPSEDPEIAASINPNDIESIDVLKDASATAIYGARGANGVIMITTKRGKIGAPKVNYDFSAGVQWLPSQMNMMNAFEFVKLQSEVYTAAEMTGNFGYFQTYDGKTYNLEDYRNVPQYNWQDMIFKDAWQQSHNISLTGGTEGVRYTASASYFDQDGIVIHSNYNKMQGRGALTVRKNKFHTYLTVNYSSSEQTGASPSQNSYSGMNNLFYSVWGYRPVTQPSLPLSTLLDNIQDPTLETLNDYRFNPIMSLNNDYNKRFINNLQFNGFIEYEIIKNLKFKVLGAYTADNRRQEVFNNSKTRYGYPGSTLGINGSLATSEKKTWLNENTLSYNTLLKKVHSINAVGGITFSESKYKYDYMSSANIPFESLGMAGLDDGTPYAIRSVKEDEGSMSFLGRINYNYDQKYYATASMRADGSSKFDKSHRWGYFPSTSLAWSFSEEQFFTPLKNIVNAGKLRVGWGLTGNNRVGTYDRFSELKMQTETSGLYINQDGIGHAVYPFDGNVNSVGVMPTRLGNKDLKWETTSQTNIGVDINLFKDRIILVAEWYDKITRDLLLDQALPFSTGYGQVARNIGEVGNRGFEFTINTQNIKTKDFTWTSSFNISFNRNKVLKLADNAESMTTVATFDQTFNGSANYIAKKGYPIGMMYGYIYDGTYKLDDFNVSGSTYSLKEGIPYYTSETNPQPGYPRYRDLNGDGVVDASDRTIIGKGDPKHIGGFTNNFEYKGFDLNIFLQWSYGNDILNANRLMFEGGFSKKDLNQFASYANRWTFENPDSDMPRYSTSSSNNVISSRIIEDGSYLRIKNITLGYTVPLNKIKKLNLSRVRIYASVQNLYTFTNYSGYDPEVSIKNNALNPGLDFSAYPRAASFNFGLNLGF